MCYRNYSIGSTPVNKMVARDENRKQKLRITISLELMDRFTCLALFIVLLF